MFLAQIRECKFTEESSYYFTKCVWESSLSIGYPRTAFTGSGNLGLFFFYLFWSLPVFSLISIHSSMHSCTPAPAHPFIHPSMVDLMPQRQSSATALTIPPSYVCYLRTFGLMLYTDYIQDLREGTSSSRYRGASEQTPNLCDTKNPVMYLVTCQRFAGLCHLAALSAYVQSLISLRELAVTCSISLPWWLANNETVTVPRMSVLSKHMHTQRHQSAFPVITAYLNRKDFVILSACSVRVSFLTPLTPSTSIC